MYTTIAISILIISIIIMKKAIIAIVKKYFVTDTIIPINKYYGINKDSQTPVKLKK